MNLLMISVLTIGGIGVYLITRTKCPNCHSRRVTNHDIDRQNYCWNCGNLWNT